MKLRHAVLLPCVLAGLVLTTGCFWMLLGAGAGAAGTAYHMGRQKSNEDVSLPVAYEACQQALRTLRIQVREKNSDALVARISALTADNKEVKIELKKISDSTTEMVIYLLPLPDKDRTLAIYDQIKLDIDAAKRRSTP
jgi:hypothetical protein